jgi:hypothetical protein
MAPSPRSGQRRSRIRLKLATFDYADEPGCYLRILAAEYIPKVMQLFG